MTNQLEYFSQDLQVTFSSCSNDSETSISKQFAIKLSSLKEALGESDHWLPVYIDTNKWSDIEFICHMQIEFAILFDEEIFSKNFQYIMIEDRTRSLCNVFKQLNRATKEHSIEKVSYEIGG